MRNWFFFFKEQKEEFMYMHVGKCYRTWSYIIYTRISKLKFSGIQTTCTVFGYI